MFMNIDAIPLLSTISLRTSTQTYQGMLLPGEKDVVILKLSSGYNVGISRAHIQSVQVISPAPTAEKKKQEAIKQDATLPAVHIVHTGGTIASKVDYTTGGVVASFNPEELLQLFPELSTIACISSELAGNMQSDDFRFSHFNTLARAIQQSYMNGKTKFIVTSGTDFLHYLSSALSFLLKDFPVGVLVVGSQRSSDRGSSDAGMNLICATQFLAQTSFTGVGVCMHASQSDDTCLIHVGTNVRKMHSSRRDAFASINTAPLAQIHYPTKQITLLTQLPEMSTRQVPDTLPFFREDIKVGLLYSRPQLFEEELAVYDSYDGLVLVGSGLGHFPITLVDNACKEHVQIQKTISLLAKKIPVVMSVQTIYGRVHMHVYSPARLLQELGVLGHGSIMTPETSYIKLAWLLSNYSVAETRTLFMQDIVGELAHGNSLRQ